MKLDHIVYGVPDLEKAINAFQEQAGIAPTIAGKHPGLGTHNAVLSLGNLQYLEFIAIDPEAHITNRVLPSWCAALLEISKPKIMTWVIRTDNMAEIVSKLNALGNLQIEPPQTFTRTKSDGTIVSMELAFKKEAPPPYDGLVPFFINWGKTKHPSETVESKCEIKEWYGCHPKAKEIESLLSQVGIQFVVKERPTVEFHLKLQTPKGEVVIN